MAGKKSLFALFVALLAGCASVPMADQQQSQEVKKFTAPANGNAGLYVYRSGSLGGALKKDIWVDGKCLGESAPNVFFYEEVKGGVDHKLSTESEFSPNDLVLRTDGGKNYFVRQYMKFGVFVGGAGLEVVSDEEGKKEIAGLSLARSGTCSN